jgi:hypothetical protein
MAKPTLRQSDNHGKSQNAGIQPSAFLRALRPELFSDSRAVEQPRLTRAVFEYYLDTLTSRKQEIEFETFCRRLAEKELCPNLLPQTGPTGGGDSKVDSETYPVSGEISDRWYVSKPQEAGEGRWAFAFSAKEDWRTKVQQDVKKIVETRRGYILIYFISNQFIRDKERADVQHGLEEKYSVPVRILDRSWITKVIFDHDRLALAIDTLNLTDYDIESCRVAGRHDVQRQAELDQLEKEIADPDRYVGVQYQLAEDCLRGALICRGLERPRTEVEGKFARAERIAKKVGHPRQRLRVAYEKGLTALWWYDDFQELSSAYSEVEELALVSTQAADLDRLGNLLTLLQHCVRAGHLQASTAQLEKRTAALKAALDRLANDRTRPGNALSAKANGLLIDLSAAVDDTARRERALKDLRSVILAADGLPSFPLTSIVKIVTGLGAFLTASPAYDELFEAVTSVMAKRVSEGEAGRLLSQRGFQKLGNNEPYEAIRLFGRAQLRLGVREYREQFVTALVGCGLAYKRVGLFWAARANYLAAVNQALSDYWEDGTVLPSVMGCFLKLVWIELRLGRVPWLLQWAEAASSVAFNLASDESWNHEAATNERSEQDRILGLLLLRASLADLRVFDFLPEVLDRLGLDYSRMALLYALGYESYLRQTGVIPDDESEDDVTEFFQQWLTHPASEGLPEQPEWLRDHRVQLRSIVLGCEIVADVDCSLSSLYLGEAIIAALESLLATSVELSAGVIPYVPEFRIRIITSDSTAELPQFRFVEDGSAVEIVLAADDGARAARNPREFQSWLGDLVVQILGRVITGDDPETFARKVFGDELGIGRALSFADPSIPIGNVIGESPKFRFADWELAADAPRFPLVRTEPWSGRVKPPTLSNGELKSEQAPSVEIAKDSPIMHQERRICSLINIPLWNRAKWNATLYLLPMELDALPLLAIGFADPDAGQAIFREWRSKLGPVDEHEQLRVSIVTGVSRERPFAYRVVLNTNLQLASRQKVKEIIQISRTNSMNPSDSRNLDGFLNRLSRVAAYQMLPAWYKIDGKEPEIFYDLWIGKRVLSVRPAWQVSVNDPESIAIQASDDPVIPDTISDAPVLQVLERARRRQGI